MGSSKSRPGDKDLVLVVYTEGILGSTWEEVGIVRQEGGRANKGHVSWVGYFHSEQLGLTCAGSILETTQKMPEAGI